MDKMKKSGNGWVDYWDIKPASIDAILRKNMEIFVERTRRLLKYNRKDVILDIGSGPGYFELLLKDYVKEIHGVDTSKIYIGESKKEFRNSNVFFYLLDRKDYTNLSFLKYKKFSKIICLSVIQYYSSVNEVEKLIKEVRKIALPGSKFLIADILVNNNIFLDIAGILKTAIREGNVLEKIRNLYHKRTSEYYKFYTKNKLLAVSVRDLHGIISHLGLNAVILKHRLTVNENRRHLLIQF